MVLQAAAAEALRYDTILVDTYAPLLLPPASSSVSLPAPSPLTDSLLLCHWPSIDLSLPFFTGLSLTLSQAGPDDSQLDAPPEHGDYAEPDIPVSDWQ